MHLPWTQVANEVLDHAAGELAAALDWHEDPEIAEALALAGLVRFFRWARERCPNDRPPSASAVLTEPHAPKLIARQMRWRGDPEALISALERVSPSPIAIREPEGIRINGLDRYDSAWAKNFKEAAAAWREAHPDGKRTESGRSAPGSRTPDPDPDPDPEAEEPPPPPAGGSTRGRVAVVVGETETASLFEAMQVQREEAGLQREARQPKGFRVWHLEFRRVGHQDYQALRGHRDFLQDKSIRRPGHPTGVFIHAEVWPLRIPPPELPPQPRVRPGQLPLEEPTKAPGAADWDAMLGALREQGKTYALGWLQRLAPVALEGFVLTLQAPDEHFLAWVQDFYGELLVRLGRERSLAVQLRTPGPAPPVTAGATVDQQMQAKDERHRRTGEVLQLVRDATVGGS